MFLALSMSTVALCICFYFDMEFIIGIGIFEMSLELLFVIGVELIYNETDPKSGTIII